MYVAADLIAGLLINAGQVVLLAAIVPVMLFNVRRFRQQEEMR